jgi:hypothetical protein
MRGVVPAGARGLKGNGDWHIGCVLYAVDSNGRSGGRTRPVHGNRVLNNPHEVSP